VEFIARKKPVDSAVSIICNIRNLYSREAVCFVEVSWDILVITLIGDSRCSYDLLNVKRQ